MDHDWPLSKSSNQLTNDSCSIIFHRFSLNSPNATGTGRQITPTGPTVPSLAVDPGMVLTSILMTPSTPIILVELKESLWLNELNPNSSHLMILHQDSMWKQNVSPEKLVFFGRVESAELGCGLVKPWYQPFLSSLAPLGSWSAHQSMESPRHLGSSASAAATMRLEKIHLSHRKVLVLN